MRRDISRPLRTAGSTQVCRFCISHEERLARELYDALQTALYGTSEDKILSYKTALGHTRELIDSLAVTRHALEQYLEQVQEAAMHLRKKCLELEIPDFFE